MYGTKDYQDYADFVKHYHIDRPENYNFAFDCIDRMAAETPNKVAMVWHGDSEGTKRYTFEEMRTLSDGAARFFRAIGIGKGDMVMLILRRRAHFWFAVLGLMKIGAIAIPATHQLTAEDIVYRNNSAGTCAIVTTDDTKLIAAVEASLPDSPSVKNIIRIGEKEAPGADENWLCLDAEIRARVGDTHERLEKVTENSDMLVLYFTSGTTGLPKMVAHNHLYPLSHITTARYWHGLHEESLHLTLSDTGWAKASWGKLFGQWIMGAAIFVYEHEKLNAHRLLSAMSEHKVTSFCAPPTVYRVLINADFGKYDLSALEHACSAGEPLNEDVFNKFRSLTGLSIYEAYGQTETTAIILTSVYSQPRPGSIGLPNPFYDVCFLDEAGNDVAGDAVGEMCLRIKPGDMGVFMGYHGNETMTEDVWRGGVYHTGDLAWRDADGYVWFVGRADDIIKTAGYRVGPFEVESVIQEHDAVMEVAVTGMPDPLRGQIIKASIILNEGYEPSDALKKEIRNYVKANAAAYKIPRAIEFVRELPKTFSGKVRRTEIRKGS
jgi:acetyl-CoA synthetase